MSDDWIGKWGRAHASVKIKLSKMSKIEARRWLKKLGFTHGEQSTMIREAIKNYEKDN
jgi:hypothetical protein